jgi:hypothetical protein
MISPNGTIRRTGGTEQPGQKEDDREPHGLAWQPLPRHGWPLTGSIMHRSLVSTEANLAARHPDDVRRGLIG